MYTSFYNLNNKPFALNHNPSFLWLGENHQKVFSSLHTEIIGGEGFLLLTGTAGTGKTTLIMALKERLVTDVLLAVITDPRLERVDFYNAIARGFGLEKRFSSKVQFLVHFSHFLHKAEHRNKKVLLVVDNCHRLRQEMLEELRLLASIEKEDVKLLNIFFVGLPEFNETLAKPKNRAVQQRFICKARLPALDVDETADYIQHRLKIAGAGEELFTAAAIQAVYRFSQGIPRLINIICDRALTNGSLQAKQNINDKIIESCIEKMDQPATFLEQKSHGSSFYQKIIAEFDQQLASPWRFIREKSSQGGWLRYVLVFFSLIVIGSYFWLATTSPPEKSPQGGGAEIAREPEVMGTPQIRSLPVVPVPAEKKIDIKEEQVIQPQTTIRIRPLVIKEKRDRREPAN